MPLVSWKKNQPRSSICLIERHSATSIMHRFGRLPDRIHAYLLAEEIPGERHQRHEQIRAARRTGCNGPANLGISSSTNAAAQKARRVAQVQKSILRNAFYSRRRCPLAMSPANRRACAPFCRCPRTCLFRVRLGMRHLKGSVSVDLPAGFAFAKLAITVAHVRSSMFSDVG